MKRINIENIFLDEDSESYLKTLEATLNHCLTKEIPNTNDTKLIVQQIDESTGKEIARREMTLTNKSIEEAEEMVNNLMAKYLTDGSNTQVVRKPFAH